MNPQATQPYTQCLPYNLADWDYGIDNTERWYAKTALDWHYAAGGLHPMDYNNRLSAIMVATMWSHLVAVFADLPAPGPTYDGGQLFKACQKSTENALCIVHGGDYSVVNSVPSVHTVCNCRRQPHTTHDIARTIIGFYNSYQGEMHNRTP